MNLQKISELYREIKRVVKDEKNSLFPVEHFFNKGMGHPIFKITIEKQENDIYVDHNGQKWVKFKEQEEKDGMD